MTFLLYAPRSAKTGPTLGWIKPLDPARNAPAATPFLPTRNAQGRKTL